MACQRDACRKQTQQNHPKSRFFGAGGSLHTSSLEPKACGLNRPPLPIGAYTGFTFRERALRPCVSRCTARRRNISFCRRNVHSEAPLRASGGWSLRRVKGPAGSTDRAPASDCAGRLRVRASSSPSRRAPTHEGLNPPETPRPRRNPASSSTAVDFAGETFFEYISFLPYKNAPLNTQTYRSCDLRRLLSGLVRAHGSPAASRGVLRAIDGRR
jgi:hypothetical protein